MSSLPKDEVGYGSAVAGFRHRLFYVAASFNSQTRMTGLTKTSIKKAVVFNASIAELLLVNRLRARVHPKTQAADIMKRAANIVFVSCKNWFPASEGTPPQRRTPS